MIGNLQPILLINPNSSTAITNMMVALARAAIADSCEIIGATATRAPSIILQPPDLIAAGAEVTEIAASNEGNCSGIIVSAFGDPGLDEVRKRLSTPSTGICEASMLEAANGNRRFGIATTTGELTELIEARAHELGFTALYTGISLTEAEAVDFGLDSDDLQISLAKAIKVSIERDKAEAVIIGGGPLGFAASKLQGMFSIPIIAPIASAARRIVAEIEKQRLAG